MDLASGQRSFDQPIVLLRSGSLRDAAPRQACVALGSLGVRVGDP